MLRRRYSCTDAAFPCPINRLLLGLSRQRKTIPRMQQFAQCRSELESAESLGMCCTPVGFSADLEIGEDDHSRIHVWHNAAH